MNDFLLSASCQQGTALTGNCKYALGILTVSALQTAALIGGYRGKSVSLVASNIALLTLGALGSYHACHSCQTLEGRRINATRHYIPSAHHTGLLAYIPARGGSKSIPLKNLAEVSDKPLVAHAVQQALDAGVFSKVVVSTDHKGIAETGKQYGAQVIDRPPELCQDHSTNLEGVMHALDYLENNENYRPSHFCILQPTSPLRKGEQIRAAVSGMLEKNADATVSVTECQHHPQKTLRVATGKNGVEPMISWDTMVQSRQTLPGFYRPNGAIHCCSVNYFKESSLIFSDQMEIFVMSHEDSTDIDKKEDLKEAEMTMLNRSEI